MQPQIFGKRVARLLGSNGMHGSFPPVGILWRADGMGAFLECPVQKPRRERMWLGAQCRNHREREYGWAPSGKCSLAAGWAPPLSDKN